MHIWNNDGTFQVLLHSKAIRRKIILTRVGILSLVWAEVNFLNVAHSNGGIGRSYLKYLYFHSVMVYFLQ